MSWPDAFAIAAVAFAFCWLGTLVAKIGATRPRQHDSNARIVEALLKRKPVDWRYTHKPAPKGDE